MAKKKRKRASPTRAEPVAPAPAVVEEQRAEGEEQRAEDEEQRHAPRTPIAVEVSLESEHNFYAGVTDNVSKGGVFFASSPHPPTGAEVELDLALGDDAERYQLRGVVSWVREHATDFAPAGCGIRWIELPPSAEQAIRRFVEQRETILYED